MGKEETAYLTAGKKIKGSEESQMFGKPCFKIKGKAFMCFFENETVFKLGGSDHEAAMKLKGAHLFDPSGKGRAMKEWVQVAAVHSKQWEKFAEAAMKYVKAQTK